MEKLQISIRSTEGEFVLFVDESKISPSKAILQKILSSSEVEIVVNMGEGNFSALAYSRI